MYLKNTEKIKIITQQQKDGTWRAHFPEKPGEYGVAKNSEGAITALLQNNLGKIVLLLVQYIEIEHIDSTPAE